MKKVTNQTEPESSLAEMMKTLSWLLLGMIIAFLRTWFSNNFKPLEQILHLVQLEFAPPSFHRI